MLKMTRIILPLAILIVACSDSPSAVATNARSSKPLYSIGGTSANQGIDDIVTALNAGWAAKSAAGYAAPFAEDAEVITPVGTTLSGRAAIQARHAFLFSGPLASSSQIVSIRRLQFLTGTIAIADGDAVLTNGSTVTRTLVRWVLTKDGSVWEIEAQQSTTAPAAP
jgi:uncharacterized protein (TIGR02246 family)